jgi:amino acid adenylation domain-containing protein
MTNKSISAEFGAAASQSLKERAYWLQKLSGDPGKSCFVYDFNKTGNDLPKMESVTSPLTPQLCSRLLWMSNQSDARLHMILVAGFVMLLNKYTESKDIILGTTIYRQKVEGDFINTVLPLRNRVWKDMTFKELLLQVKQTITGAVEHQNYPIKSLLYDLNLAHSEYDFPLFDIAVIVENIQDWKYIRHIHTNINVSFSRTGEDLECKVEYNGELYRRETIEGITGHFNHLMQQALFNVDLPLSQIDLISRQERKKILEEFNNTTKYGNWAEKTIHQLFEEQVEKTPGNIALVWDEKKDTYGTLNEKSNRLARLLRKKGSGPRCITALLMESSLHMAAAIIAVLKAGGAYLPIDLELPQERKKYILQDSGACLLLTDNGLEHGTGVIPPGIEAINVCEKNLLEDIKESINPDTFYKPSLLAYVIYTSGSTGKPKGVMVEHRQAVNTLVHRKELYNMTSENCALQLFSYAFDGFITSFFTPIVSGARVILLNKDTLLDISKIAEIITAFGVTHFISVPIMFQALLSGMTGAEAASLQVVTLAGDRVQPRLVEMAAAKNKNLEVVNEYGVTEAAVMSTIYRHQERDLRVKIGHPIGNTSIYITNNGDHQQLAPIGVFGEMCIAGAGVTRGYLNNPELTAEKFDHDLWDYRDYHDGNHRSYRSYMSHKSHRTYIYKTGDLARWLPDGNIEFGGRQDFQVKVRGFRIEPGEIERQLLTHEHIKETVVTASESEHADKYLCAYLTGTRQLSIAELREFLSGRLPEYMIPAYFVFLEKLPLSSNGKVDRKQLPDPDTAMSTKEYAPPRNHLEQELVEIWAGVLESSKDDIGIDADFFELGGHSLSATLMSNRILKDLNVKVPMVQIFEAPTIRNLSEYISSAAKETFVSIQPREKKEFYPLSSAQRRMFLLNQIKSNDVSDNTPEVMMVEGNLNRKHFEKVIKQLIDRHEAFRTSCEFIGKKLVQRIHDDVVWEIEDYKCSPPESEAIIRQFIRPFDLGKAPLLRVGLITLAEKKRILIYDIHHIVRDAVSTEIFIKDFFYLYEELELPPLRLQYKDFAIWQNQRLESGIIAQQEKYWLEVFSGEIPTLNIPTDYPRPAQQSFDGETVSGQLNKNLTRKINEIVQENDVTLSMVLLTIYNILLSKYSGQEDIVVAIPISGRSHANLEDIVGIFLNTLPIRNYPQGEKTFSEFLEEVKSSMLNAYENQEYQFDALVNRLDLKPDPARNPLFDTMLVVQTEDTVPMGSISDDMAAREMKGVSFRPYAYEKKSTQFEILFYIWENGGVIDLVVSYCIKIFKKETLESFLEHFEEIANCVVHHKQIKLKDIKLTESFSESGSTFLNEAKIDLEF